MVRVEVGVIEDAHLGGADHLRLVCLRHASAAAAAGEALQCGPGYEASLP